MILAVDVGNTNITMGVYDDKVLKATFHIMTKTPRTSDEYGVLIVQLLNNRGVRISDLEGSIVASVVPDVMHSFLGALVRYTKTRPSPRIPGPSGRIGSWMRWPPTRNMADRFWYWISARLPHMI